MGWPDASPIPVGDAYFDGVLNRSADQARLEELVTALAHERHPHSSPQALDAAAELVADTLTSCGLRVERHPFTFRGGNYHNVVGHASAASPDRPRILVGAHFDTVRGTPGADDNASGVAAMLEVASLLASVECDAPVDFVGFNLEEPQGMTYRVGSRAYAADARRRGIRYAGVLVLEMVGYTDTTAGSQSVPALLFWKRVPRTGTFLAATGHGRSAKLLRTFAHVASQSVPDLCVVTFRTPFGGRIVPHTRLSDNASFWDCGYPALMITDTAFLRNPHYHRATDRTATLDFHFMSRVTTAVAATTAHLAGSSVG